VGWPSPDDPCPVPSPPAPAPTGAVVCSGQASVGRFGIVRCWSLEVEVGGAVYRLRAQADEDGRVHLQEMSAESMVQPYPARPSSGARSNRRGWLARQNAISQRPATWLSGLLRVAKLALVIAEGEGDTSAFCASGVVPSQLPYEEEPDQMVIGVMPADTKGAGNCRRFLPNQPARGAWARTGGT